MSFLLKRASWMRSIVDRPHPKQLQRLGVISNSLRLLVARAETSRLLLKCFRLGRPFGLGMFGECVLSL